MVGIILALIFRGVFILLGAHAHRELQLDLLHLRRLPALHGDPAGVPRPRGRRRRARAASSGCSASASRSPTTTTASRCARRVDGKRMFTPILIVFIAIGTTDLHLRARLDPRDLRHHAESRSSCSRRTSSRSWACASSTSCSATSLDRLEYLKYGIAFILAFIGVKLVLPRPARERAAVHQRRRAHRVGARDLHVGLARRDRRGDGRRDVASLIKARVDAKRRGAKLARRGARTSPRTHRGASTDLAPDGVAAVHSGPRPASGLASVVGRRLGGAPGPGARGE